MQHKVLSPFTSCCCCFCLPWNTFRAVQIAFFPCIANKMNGSYHVFIFHGRNSCWLGITRWWVNSLDFFCCPSLSSIAPSSWFPQQIIVNCPWQNALKVMYLQRKSVGKLYRTRISTKNIQLAPAPLISNTKVPFLAVSINSKVTIKINCYHAFLFLRLRD